MSQDVQVTSDGKLACQEETPFLWLRRLVNCNNILLQESLACRVATPLDEGEHLTLLCLAIRQFMPELVRASWEQTTQLYSQCLGTNADRASWFMQI